MKVLRRSSAVFLRVMKPAFSSPLSATTVVGSRIPTRSLSSRCVIPSSRHNWRRKRHCPADTRSEEHTSELQSQMRLSYAVLCLKKNNMYDNKQHHHPPYSF